MNQFVMRRLVPALGFGLGLAPVSYTHLIEPVLQLTCRDRNRIALQSMLVGAAAQGLHNILVLRGDDPGAGDQPEAKPVFDLDSNTLLATAAAIRDRGELPHGRAVGGRAQYFLGAADTPVSYTHLDVYKRQDQSIARRKDNIHGRHHQSDVPGF